MKLNYRDKIILGILLAFVILLGGFFLLIKPRYTDIKDNQATLESARREKEEVDAKIAEIKPLKEKIKKSYDNAQTLADDFVEYNDIYNGRKIDQYMQHFAEECEVKIVNLSVAEPSTKTLDYYFFKTKIVGEDLLKKTDINGDKAKMISEEKAESDALTARNKESVILSTYTLKVEGEKENIWKYLQALEEQKETMIIDSVSLQNVVISEEAAKELADAAAAAGAEEPKPSAQITISVYSVYDMEEPNLEAD